MEYILYLRWKTVLIIAVLLLGLSSVAFSQSLAPEKKDVLIGFEPGPTAPRAEIMGQIEALGGDIAREFTIVDAAAARVPAKKVEALAETPGVAYVEPDSEVYALQLSLQQQTVPWGIDRVFGTDNYPFSAWDYSMGAEIDVAVLDTGIDETHEDLPELSGGTNTIDETHWGLDEHGHGTMMAGVLAALDNDLGVVGISPEVNLYSVKILNEKGSGMLSSIVAGIEWSVEQDLPVLNMSLGTTEYSETLENACEAASNKGHLLVAAAGNVEDADEGDNVHYPAAFPSVLAVTASDSTDELAAISSTGPEAELIAPGVDIVSTLPEDEYGTTSGTSPAAAHASGTAALAWAADTQLSHEDIREILRDNAEDLGLEENHQGYGLVRAGLNKGADHVLMTIGSTIIEVDGVEQEIDAPPFIEEDRTFVPVRFLAEAFNAEADWGPKDTTTEWVTFTRADIEITILIGEEEFEVYYTNTGETETHIADAPARIVDGRTKLPFRAIGEAFGTEVDYSTDPDTGLVDQVWFTQ